MSSPTTTPMWSPAPAGLSSTRACSWWASCASSTPTCQDPDYESAIALVHSRFSTNTNPSWERAHPNRFILHNGEINTIRGNVDRMLAREETMHSAVLAADDMDKILPVVNAERLRLRHAGQHPGISDDERHAPAPGGDDVHPGALEQRREHEPRQAGPVPLLRHHDGALGRPGLHSVLRRRLRWARCWTATACAPPGTISPTTTS